MERNHAEDLVAKFNSQQLTAAELKELERLIEKGDVDLGQLAQVDSLVAKVDQLSSPAPSLALDHRFHEILAIEKKSHRKFSWKNIFSLEDLAPKLAFASVALLIGISIGYLTRPSTTNPDMEALSQQVTDLKEMMMLSLLEKESATDRLKAVSLTQEMSTASAKVTEALIQTLNGDENVNVRLAALEALKPYVGDSSVRAEIIRSIAKQQSPLVQVALAELMAQLQVKSSVQELQKIIESDRTPTDVKKRIKESIKILS